MKIKLILTGKTEKEYIEDGMQVYLERLKHFFTVEQVIIPAVKTSKNTPVPVRKKQEAELILKKLDKADYVVLLDENGLQFSSKEFAGFIENGLNKSISKMVFIVGGSFGFDTSLKEKAHKIISLSKMTFSHQLVRLIFLEQLYRACTIAKGIPYHNE